MTEKDEPSFKDILKLTNCSLDKCNKEIEKISKLKDEGYTKLETLFHKIRLNKISKDKYNKETKKIITKINNHKSNIESIKCKINNCNDNIRNALLYIIDDGLKNIKNKKIKVILNHYQNLFKQPIINHKDIINFYNDRNAMS
jgi:hypothetical protein